MMMTSFCIVVAALLCRCFASVAISQTCSNGICFSLNIPEHTANSTSKDIFLQIRSPSRYQWVGLGQGKQMAGGNMFVIYTSSNGQNVTVSPRLGTGEVEPQHNANTQIALLAGSGVQNGTMVANIHCRNCDTWQGGSMDFSGSSGEWMMAYKEGSPLNTDDLSASIAEHDSYAAFTWDFTTAKGGNNANPFLLSQAANITNQTSSSGGLGDGEGAGMYVDTVKVVHAIFACFVFVILLPIGAILLRVDVFRLSNPVRVHAIVQLVGYTIWLLAFTMGVWMAYEEQAEDAGHAILGYVIFAIMLFQPVFGLQHHSKYKQTGHRSLWSVLHLVIGRSVILLGIINGGMGLALADDAPFGVRVTYGIVAALFGISYLAAALFGETKRWRWKKLDSTGVDESIQLQRPRQSQSAGERS